MKSIVILAFSLIVGIQAQSEESNDLQFAKNALIELQKIPDDNREFQAEVKFGVRGDFSDYYESAGLAKCEKAKEKFETLAKSLETSDPAEYYTLDAEADDAFKICLESAAEVGKFAVASEQQIEQESGAYAEEIKTLISQHQEKQKKLEEQKLIDAKKAQAAKEAKMKQLEKERLEKEAQKRKKEEEATKRANELKNKRLNAKRGQRENEIRRASLIQLMKFMKVNKHDCVKSFFKNNQFCDRKHKQNMKIVAQLEEIQAEYTDANYTQWRFQYAECLSHVSRKFRNCQMKNMCNDRLMDFKKECDKQFPTGTFREQDKIDEALKLNACFSKALKDKFNCNERRVKVIKEVEYFRHNYTMQEMEIDEDYGIKMDIPTWRNQKQLTRMRMKNIEEKVQCINLCSEDCSYPPTNVLGESMFNDVNAWKNKCEERNNECEADCVRNPEQKLAELLKKLKQGQKTKISVKEAVSTKKDDEDDDDTLAKDDATF